MRTVSIRPRLILPGAFFTGLILVLAVAAAYRSPPREPDAEADHTLSASGTVGLAFSGDGETLLTAGPRSVTVWAVKDYRKLLTVRPPEGQEFSLATLSRDGQTLLTASGDEAVTWSAVTGKRLRVFRHGSTVGSAQISHDGRLVLTTGADRIVRVWEAESGAPVRSREFRGRVYSAEFSPDGTGVLSVSGAPPDNFRPRYWITKDGKEGEGPETHNEADVHLWEVTSGADVVRPRRVFREYQPNEQTGLEPWLRPAALSPDGTRWAYFNLPEGLIIRRRINGPRGHLGLIQADYDDELDPGGRLGTGSMAWVAFASNDELFIAGGNGRRAVISVPRERIVRQFDTEADAIDPSPDGRLAIARSSAGSVAVFEIVSARKLLEVRCGEAGMPLVAVHPDSVQIAISFPSERSTKIFSIPVAGQETGR